jgi:type IV secretion system protein VirB10
MHFTSMIFPNGTVIEVPGAVSGIPGSTGPKVKNSEGTVEQSGGAGDVAKAAGKGAERGATGGVIVGAIESHPFEGAGYGAAAGAVIGAAVSLFTHGNDVNILAGSQVEMVLQRDLILQESNLADAASGPTFLPTPQRQPMQKPNSRRILCPGGSACQ